MAARYFTQNKRGEDVELSEKHYLEAIRTGKRTEDQFTIEGLEDEVPVHELQGAADAETSSQGFTPETVSMKPKELEERLFAQEQGFALERGGEDFGAEQRFADTEQKKQESDRVEMMNQIKKRTQGMSDEDKKLFFSEILAGGISSGFESISEQELSPESVNEEGRQERAADRQRLERQFTRAEHRRETGTQHFGDKFNDIFLTRQLMQDKEISTDPSEGGFAFQAAMNTIEAPMRMLGSVFGFGDVSDENTKILKPLVESITAWADERRDFNEKQELFSGQLQETLDEGDLTFKQGKRVEKLIEDIEGNKKTEWLTGLFETGNNIIAGVFSDPFILKSIAKAAVKGGAKGIKALRSTDEGVGRISTEPLETAEEFAGKEIAKLEGDISKGARKVKKVGSRKKVGEANIEAARDLGRAGAPKDIIKRLSDQGIKSESGGVLKVPRKLFKEKIDQIKGVKNPQLDVRDEFEAALTSINKRELLKGIFRNNITSEVKLDDLVNDLMRAGTNSTDVKRLLVRAEFPGANEVAGNISGLEKITNGTSVRSFIQDMQRKTGSGKTANNKAFQKVDRHLRNLLRGKIKAQRTPEDLMRYNSSNEIGAANFGAKQGKLRNILVKNKGDETINTAASVKKLEKMFDDAVEEIALGVKAFSVDNLKEIDNISGTNIFEIARDFALMRKLDPEELGKISAGLPTGAPSIASGINPMTAGAAGGPGLGSAFAVQRIGVNVFKRMDRRKLRRLLTDIAKNQAKIDNVEFALKNIPKGVEDGAAFIHQALTGENALKNVSMMVQKGHMTLVAIKALLGKSATNKIIKQSEKSTDKREIEIGKKFKKTSN